MTFHADQVVTLFDGTNRRIGDLTVERIDNDLLFARIRPGPDFAVAEPLFRAFEEAVELQALKKVDELDGAIAALNLHLVTDDDQQSTSVHDVQVWSDGEMTCRLTPVAPPSVNGAADRMARLEARSQQTETHSPVRSRPIN
jgi:hypothetical protein